jgi:hypothetical protein
VFTFTIDAADTTGAAVSKTYTVTVPANVVATSTIATRVWPVGSGTTTGDGVYENGTPITVAASHGPGYAFVVWTEGGANVSSSASYPFTVNGDRSLVANFLPVYAVTTAASPVAGGVTTGDGSYLDGDSVTVQATPNGGYTFLDWSEAGNVVSATASYTFTAHAARDLVADFARITYTIGTSVAPAGSGTTSGAGTYNSGDSVTVQAIANAGYAFVNWTEAGNVVSSASSYTFNAAANRTLVANFDVLAPVLELTPSVPSRINHKLEVPLTLRNTGNAAAESITIVSRKMATLDGKSANERAPLVLGNLSPGSSTSTSLTFTGIKAGTWTLELTVVYTGGTATFTVPITVP